MANCIYPIVKPVLPPIESYNEYVQSAFDRDWLTNKGPLLQELESKLADYLGVDNLVLVANGTLALQVAYKALGIEDKVLTTPFTFAATTSSLLWQGVDVEYTDVCQDTFNADVDCLSNLLEENPGAYNAFVGVHVFGNPCAVEAIDNLAKQHRLKVVYDAAHAFAVNYKGESLLRYGDAATLSLHATKVFHCVEGGAIVFKRKEDADRARSLINFGFDQTGFPLGVGINAKMSEIHAAMGLSLLPNVQNIIAHRAALTYRYRQKLEHYVDLQHWCEDATQNGAYMPVLLRGECEVVEVMAYLASKGIQTRRYFYPSLSQVDSYRSLYSTAVSDRLSLRVLCLPMFFDLTLADVDYICKETIDAIKKLKA